MSISVAVGVDLALSLLESAARVSAIVRQAQAEGKSRLTDDQWRSILDMDTEAKTRLEEAIGSAEE